MLLRQRAHCRQVSPHSPITPTVVDTWTDANGDARYQPLDGDIFEDGNGNGMFDPVWIAGFHNRRPANGIHDDLWARVMIIDDGQTRLAIVALDAVGLFHDDVIDIRKMLPPQLEIDYAIVCSTHDHEAPDLLGLWGGGWFKSGVDPNYMAHVKSQSVKASFSSPVHTKFFAFDHFKQIKHLLVQHVQGRICCSIMLKRAFSKSMAGSRVGIMGNSLFSKFYATRDVCGQVKPFSTI